MTMPSWTGRLTPWQGRLLQTLSFLARVIALSLPLYVVMWLGVSLYPLQVAAASQSAWLLNAFGYEVVQSGTGLMVNSSFEFFIIPDCTGWKSMLFLSALVLAVPGVALRKRLKGLAAGIPLVWIGNLGRIVGVVVVQGMWGTGFAMLVHDTLFQAGLAAMVLGLWVTWLFWDRIRARAEEVTRQSSGALSRLRLSWRGQNRSYQEACQQGTILFPGPRWT
jgi:exosortase/archaeosortase family protein